jgi:hypothetical protein
MFCLINLSLSAQETVFDQWNVSAHFHRGFILPHHSSIKYYIEDFVTGYEARFYKDNTKEDIYDQYFRYPHTGFAFYHSNLGNEQIYGNITGLYGYLDVPFFKKIARFNLNYMIGLGLSYINKTFDVNKNISNTAIGTHNNVFIRFNTNASYKISPQLKLIADLNFSHASNGKLGTPNQGLNILTTSAGFSYSFNNHKQPKLNKMSHSTSPKWHYYIQFGGGAKIPDDFHDKYYFASTIHTAVKRELTINRRLGGGIDVFYDGSKGLLMRRDGLEPSGKKDFWALGLHADHDLVYKKLSMTVQAGYYIWAGYLEFKRSYFRVGFTYDVAPRWHVGVFVKSHYAIADYVEWGIGYKLFKDKTLNEN